MSVRLLVGTDGSDSGEGEVDVGVGYCHEGVASMTVSTFRLSSGVGVGRRASWRSCRVVKGSSSERFCGVCGVLLLCTDRESVLSLRTREYSDTGYCGRLSVRWICRLSRESCKDGVASGGVLLREAETFCRVASCRAAVIWSSIFS